MSSEGMEVLRVVARIPLRQDTYPDGPDMVAAYQAPFLFGLTPAHVRQARAIVAAAERKEVTRDGIVTIDEALAGAPSDLLYDDDDDDDTAPPTAGPVPEAGAPMRPKRHFSREDLVDEIAGPYFGEATPSPQPPAPAEGGTDVAELIHKLESLLASDRSTRAHRLHAILLVEEAEAIQEAADALTAQAAALVAKEAEIERLREALQEIKHHTHNADAAALWFGEINRIADAALTQKGPAAAMMTFLPGTPLHIREAAFTDWREWFAWRPVRTEQRNWVWMRSTWRRKVFPPPWFCPPAPAAGWFEYSDEKRSSWEPSR